MIAQAICTSIGIITVLILFGSAHHVYAQEPDIKIKEWDVPSPNSAPHDIVVDNKTGITWFTEISANKIGRFDPKTEQFKEFDIPTQSSGPHGLVIDEASDNIIWFTEMSGSKIGKLDAETGKVDEFPTPTPNSGPHTPIMGKGVVWFTEIQASKIGRLNLTTGVIDEFPTPTAGSSPYGIITDSEGNAWFAELTGHKIGKVDADTGKIIEYSTPTNNSGTRRIAIDGEGKLWFTEYNSAKIGSFDPKTEEFKEYETISPSSGPYAIWVDIYDNVWFSMTNSYKVGKFDQSAGKLQEYDLPTSRTIIRFMYADSQGNVWFANNSNNKIGVITANEGEKDGDLAALPSPYPPIVITKVDPWTPLRGPDDGVKPCLVQGSSGQIDNWAYAWIELSNITNETLTTTDVVTIEVKSINSSGIGGSGSSEGLSDSLVLEPNQSCIIATSNPIFTRIGVGGGEGNSPTPGADKGGAIVSINYTISNTSSYDGVYTYSTPALSDPYGDLAYWQLDSGKWIFKDNMAGKRNLSRTMLTDMTTPANVPILVNLTLPEDIQAPAVIQLGLSFINSTTKQQINDVTVVYEIEYKGSPLLYNIRNGGHTNTGSDVKYIVVNQTGSLDIAVKITALNREAAGGSFDRLANPEAAQFTVAVVPEFGSHIASILVGTSIAGLAGLRKYFGLQKK
jgi:virginiamycin B lyase